MDQWPQRVAPAAIDPEEELKRSAFCGLTVPATKQTIPEVSQYKTFAEYLEASVQHLHGAAAHPNDISARDSQEAELIILQQVQHECFPAELTHLRASKPVPSSSRLAALAPEFDNTSQLIRVGGRLRRSGDLEEDAIHPIVLDSHHPVTKLIIQDFDEKIHHPGAERVFAEVRRRYWVLRGREAIRHHQRHCTECRKWRGRPDIPKIADLPPARLRLMRPAFYSTGVDCFGPYQVKISRRTEKRWGIIFKCMTTRAVHVDLLTSIDTDAFLMALRRFIFRRGKPFELLSDQDTNFKGGERELQDAFSTLQPQLRAQLASQQISFTFNPPEGILNSKPLGYTSSDVADLDPVTPNSLLMGRANASLPQVLYPESEMLGRRRWRHS
ncbi:hypothetical protein SKAU_G00091660 [Synaphobranchus kaupii]|uniref:Integrase zinc-binding domain-containing protein n=1 Tax=Synaphobranchus kaupii TaxID=118154 RepID=A0A9Q1J6J7_SYNKA|nr:hypothetical protein SKAU_G00091660 [Synaphobranchus kaupii]